MNIEKKIHQYIEVHDLFTPQHRLLCTTSGGVDSMVLLHFLHTHYHNVEVAHCNFKLRGEAADQDELFVKNFCLDNQIRCHTISFDTSQHASNHHISIQMAARDLRYNWFNELIKKHELDYIITAHHINDQLETILFNLAKGTGISGLRGMPNKTQNIRRPLLEIPKVALYNYAKENNIKWREDASNQSSKYGRNLIRNKVLPLLKEINPSLETTAIETIERVSHTEELVSNQVTQILKKCIKNKLKFQIPLAEVQENPVVLHQLIKRFQFNYPQSVEILTAFSQHASGKQWNNKNYQAFLQQHNLHISPIQSEDIFQLQITCEGTYTTPVGEIHINMVDINEVSFGSDKNVCFFDALKTSFPLTIRNWEQGDKLHPLGMKGKKKISDIYIDAKIPVVNKKNFPILISNQKIVWLVGLRQDETSKITTQTKRVLKLKWVPYGFDI